jgi:hypothetical protein
MWGVWGDGSQDSLQSLFAPSSRRAMVPARPLTARLMLGPSDLSLRGPVFQVFTSLQGCPNTESTGLGRPVRY